jgi:type II secretory pathway component PulC
MRFIGYLSRSVNLLNILLLGLLGVAVVSVVFPYSHMKVRYVVPPGKAKVSQEEEKTPETLNPSPADYALISDRNLFHPERIIPVDKKTEVPKPELILYGTLVSDDLSVAFIEDKKAPATTPGRGKRQTAVKKGDTISGFVVTEIATDKIVLQRGDERMTVSLIDSEKRKGADVPRPGVPATDAQRRAAEIQRKAPGTTAPTAQHPPPAVQQPRLPVQPGTSLGTRRIPNYTPGRGQQQ